MPQAATYLALCSSVSVDLADGRVPDWIHLLPSGEARTVDGRGPYTVNSMQSICEQSMANGARLPIDEAHATDKGAMLGLAHPARGWIVEMQSRASGIWGKVEWNMSGRALMEDRAYYGISPVIRIDKAGNVLQVLRASLTNTPNLLGMAALQSQRFKPSQPSLDVDDHAIMALFNIDEEAYRAALAKLNMQKQVL
jgi:phage I-like protein